MAKSKVRVDGLLIVFSMVILFLAGGCIGNLLLNNAISKKEDIVVLGIYGFFGLLLGVGSLLANVWDYIGPEPKEKK